MKLDVITKKPSIEIIDENRSKVVEVGTAVPILLENVVLSDDLDLTYSDDLDFTIEDP